MVVHVYSMPQVVHVTLDNIQSGAHMITSNHAANPLIQLFRNTDQHLDILIKTIDRRPVFVAEVETIRFKVFDKHNRVVLDLEADLENYEKGHFYIDITRAQTGALTLGNYTWCMLIENSETETERLLFTDKAYGPNAPLKVLEGPLPVLAPAMVIEANDLTNSKTWALPGSAQTINTNGAHSVVLALDEYTGEMVIQASLDPDIPQTDGEWTNVSTSELEDVTGNHHVGFSGNYTWVRFIFSTTVGLNKITYRNL